ncbi:MAG: hypothetical protein LBJ63_11360 [Prevotellaceae bacterium]|jgi:hypothetical protein|nr:hypothetical protein [Prevotellaceae bacterium]
MKNKIEKKKFNFLTLENASEIQGGKHVVKICAATEIYKCARIEGTYCGTGAAIEIIGPVDPFG